LKYARNVEQLETIWEELNRSEEVKATKDLEEVFLKRRKELDKS